MSTRSSVLISLAAWSVFLAAGVQTAYLQSSPSFTPTQPAPARQISVSPQGSDDFGTTSSRTQDRRGLSGMEILNQAFEKAQAAEWLSCDIWRRHHGRLASNIEGTYRRGPKGCRRLEVAIQTGASRKGQFVVVSDGKVLAEVFQGPGTKPRVKAISLGDDVLVMKATLNQRGGDGPAGTLERLRAEGHAWTVTTSQSGSRKSITITNVLVPTVSTKSHLFESPIPARSVRVNLDHETLWPDRIEWWSGESLTGELLCELEFRQPRINQPLSASECAKEFSYQAPNSTEAR